MNASTGQVIERLVKDVIYLDAQVKKQEYVQIFTGLIIQDVKMN